MDIGGLYEHTTRIPIAPNVIPARADIMYFILRHESMFLMCTKVSSSILIVQEVFWECWNTVEERWDVMYHSASQVSDSDIHTKTRWDGFAWFAVFCVGVWSPCVTPSWVVRCVLCWCPNRRQTWLAAVARRGLWLEVGPVSTSD